MKWIDAHPRGRGWTLNDIAKFRMSLLETHRCTQTLRNIRENAQADEKNKKPPN